MGKSLAQQVSTAVDTVFGDAELSRFQRNDVNDGALFSRYLEDNAAAEHEISVYRDKWWSKDGGTAFVELYTLNRDYQAAIGGCEQTLFEPDFDRALCVFQYGTGRDAERLEHSIKGSEDVTGFAAQLHRFVTEVAIPWFDAMETPDGIESCLAGSGETFALARWQAATGKQLAAEESFVQYMLGLPRQIENELADVVKWKIITSDEAKGLNVAAIQQESDYENRVEEWAREKRKRQQSGEY